MEKGRGAARRPRGRYVQLGDGPTIKLRQEGATVASFLLMPTLMRGIELSDINYVQTNERFEKTTFQRIQQMKKRGFWSQVGDIVITIALMLFVFDLIDVLTGGKKE